MSLIATDDGRAYREHEDAVLGMLARRFPRCDAGERRELYHDAWETALKKPRQGEEVESLRSLLLNCAQGRALDRIKREARTQPVGPDHPTLTTLGDETASTEERVLIRDEARIARELIDTLEPRQRALFKLRWDLQLRPREIRAALALTRKQYMRLVEEGTASIAARVTELDDGTWSRRQRSLLTACLLGIATGEQRAEAQRRLDSDPHVRALFAEVDRVVGRAAALMPLPALGRGRPAAIERLTDTVAAAKAQLVELAGAGKQHAATLSLRAHDVTPLAGARPGAAGAAIASCLAIGGGAYCAAEGIPDTLRGPIGLELQHSEQRKPPKPPKRSDPSPEQPVAQPTPAPVRPKPAAPAPQPAPSPKPAATGTPAEQNFGIEQTSPRQAPAPAPPRGGGNEFGFER
jgi:RNA polymerase sigma factor (sigma-70 family)